MEKKVEMVCVSEMEGFSWDLYEKSKKKLETFLARFGWKYGDCILEENGKVWCCKAAAIWFLTPEKGLEDLED